MPVRRGEQEKTPVIGRKGTLSIHTCIFLNALFFSTLFWSVEPVSSKDSTEGNKSTAAIATIQKLTDEGLQHQQAGQLEAAIEKYKTALTLAQEVQDSLNIATLHLHLGLVYRAQTQYKIAVEHYRQAAKLYQDIGETARAVATLDALGDAQEDLGQSEEALVSYLNAFAIGKSLLPLSKESDREFANLLVGKIVAVSVQLGHTEELLGQLKQMAEIFRQKGEKKLAAESLHWVARTYIKLKDAGKGLAYFAKLLALSQAEKDRYLESEITYQMGILLFEAKNPEKSLSFYKRALKLSEEANNSRRAIDVLGEIGAHYQQHGKPDKALEYLERALQLSQGLEESLPIQDKATLRRSQGGTLMLVGAIYESRGQYEKAVEFYHRARVALVDGGDRQNGIGVLGLLGVAYTKLGRSQDALLAFQQQQEEEKEQGMLEWQVKGFLNLAQASEVLGETENILKYFLTAVVLCQQLGNPQQEAFILAEIGRLYWDMSRYDEALNFYHQTLNKYREVRDQKAQGEILARIGEVYRWLGDNETALRWYRDALETSRAARDVAGEARSLAALLLINAWLGNQGALDEQASQVLRVGKEIRERLQTEMQKGHVAWDEFLALIRLSQVTGEISARWGEPEQAISSLTQALQLHQRLPRTREFLKETAVDLYFLATAYGRSERYDEAFKALQEAEKIARQLHTPELYWVLNAMGVVHEQQGKLQDALDLYTQATEVLEKVSLQQRAEEIRLPVRDLASQFYLNIVGVLYKLYLQTREQQYIEKAFFYYEKGKAQVLLDLLEEAKVRVREGINPVLLQEEETITARISRLHRDLAHPELSKDREKQLLATLTEQEQAWQALRVKIAVANPKYAELTSPQIAGIQQVQAMLDKEIVLLEYVLTEEKSFLWAVTQDSMQGYELPAEEVIARQVEQYLSTLRVPLYGREEIRRHIGLGRELYQTLLQPVARQLQGKSKLIIVPDGELYYLPFETLIVSDTESPDEKSKAVVTLQSVPYLVKNYTVTYTPSASVLVTLEKERDKNRPQKVPAPALLLAFGDPVYEAIPERTAAPAPPTIASLLHTYAQRGGEFEGLRYSREEVQKIAGIYGIDVSSNAINLQEKATEKRLREMDLTPYRFLHFATHAILSDERKWITQPAVVLSLAGTDDTYDGFLQMSEIFNLRLNADLVVLSACDTGRGKLHHGEGIVGLTRAFMYAGTPSVAASLWEVNDQSTSLFMEFFYRNLKEGKSKAEALRQAKKQMIQTQALLATGKEESLAAPYFWAPFILIGSGN